MTSKRDLSQDQYSIDTFTGVSFNYKNPSNINIFDIAIPLSREPRFGGHTIEAYHVATHSLNGARLILKHGIDYGGESNCYKFLGSYIAYPHRWDGRFPTMSTRQLTLFFAKAFLFHDAAEAYMKDLPTPLKRLVPEYVTLEKTCSKSIFGNFKLLSQRIDLYENYFVIEYFDKLMFTLEFPKYMGYRKQLDYSSEYDFPKLTDEDKECLYLDPIDSDRSAILFLKTYHDINREIRELNEQLPDKLKMDIE